jgi:hypothetical protein
MVQQTDEVWIVLDALDECRTRDEFIAGGLLSWIQNLQNSQTNIHLLVTSRREQDIEAAIKSWAHDDDIIPIQSELVEDDIKAYIYSRVREQGELSRRWHSRPTIQSEIEAALIQRSDSM